MQFDVLSIERMSELIAGIIVNTSNIIAIAAAVAAGGAWIVSVFTYKHNKKSEQIRIAREEMDKISTKVQRMIEARLASEITDDSPLVYLLHIEEILKECEYFGYLIHKNVIEDEDIISYYKPEVIKVIVEVIPPGRKAFQTMKDEGHNAYPDLVSNIKEHQKLLDKIMLYWGKQRY